MNQGEKSRTIGYSNDETMTYYTCGLMRISYNRITQLAYIIVGSIIIIIYRQQLGF